MSVVRFHKGRREGRGGACGGFDGKARRARASSAGNRARERGRGTLRVLRYKKREAMYADYVEAAVACSWWLTPGPTGNVLYAGQDDRDASRLSPILALTRPHAMGDFSTGTARTDLRPDPSLIHTYDPTWYACAGTYNLYEGQSGLSDCTRCPFGYTSAPGSTQCELCPPGNVVYSFAADRPYGTCTPCARGSYNDEYSFSGAACKPCPPGFTSEAGSSNCTACPPGTFLDLRDSYNKLTCVQCSANTFNPLAAFSSTTGCPPCPKGSTSASGSANCTVCPAGSFVDVSSPGGYNYNYMTVSRSADD